MCRYVSQYVLEGHRFVHNNLTLFLHRVLVSPSSAGADADLNQSRDPEDLPQLEDCVPLDQSGAHLLVSSCYVADGSQPELIKRGVKEQVAFREAMKGIVDMRPIERLALDTRVKPER